MFIGELAIISKPIDDCSQAIQLSPDFAEAYYNRAAARQALNDRSGAINDFKVAAKLYKQQGNKENSDDALKLVWQVQHQK